MFILRNTLIAFVLLLWNASLASIVNKTLYINRGVYTTVSNTTFPWISFNATNVFDENNEKIILNVNDSLIVKIINNDTVIHGFNVKYINGVSHVINPTDSIIDTLFFSNEGLFIYYDNYQYPNNSYLGLTGMIAVLNPVYNHNFYWQIKEHQTQYSQILASGGSVNWQQYYPDYFTFNAKSYPDIMQDTTAIVKGNVGDTIRIYIINSGISSHSLHFHGYHCKVLFSSNSNMQVNSSKDTFPLKPMEAVILEMVPDKPGDYPVHDHNLQAATGGGSYPNGMLLVMTIN